MKYSGKKLGITYGKSLLIGVGVTALCIILGSMLLTTFVISGLINEDKMDIVAVAMLFVSAVIGSATMKALKGEGSASAVLILIACNIVIILLSNIIFFNAKFHSLLWKMGAIITGSAIVMLKKGRNTKKFRNFKIR